MTTNNAAHGFWDWLRLKRTQAGHKPAVLTKTEKCNAKPDRRLPGRKIVFLEMP
jgi:hypothetical protein